MIVCVCVCVCVVCVCCVCVLCVCVLCVCVVCVWWWWWCVSRICSRRHAICTRPPVTGIDMTTQVWYFNDKGQALHNRLAGTRVVRL